MTYGIGMLAVSYIHGTTVAPVLAVVMVASLCYAGGRIHQFYRQGMDRDLAFRQGYNEATKSLFSLATRTSKAMIEAPGLLDSTRTQPAVVRGAASVGVPRHLAKGKSTLQANKAPTAWERHKSA